MNARRPVDLDTGEWDDWIAEVCGHLGVDPALVDVPLIHDLTRRVAHRYQRPMAPVSSYIMGIAVGAALAERPGVDTDELLPRLVDRIDATLPQER